jgi:HEAT repeat protein
MNLLAGVWRTFEMQETTKLILERFDALATSDMAEFRQFFRRLRKQFPEQAAEACLLYMASHGVDTAAHSMAFWFGGDSPYIQILLDEESLSIDTAHKAIAVVRDIDPQFLLKFTKVVSALDLSPRILRALSLMPAIGDYSILIPWLRKLTEHPDQRVRSRSSKLLCELRPNKGLIERQMHSDDSRVRANAIEAMTHARNLDDARTLFRDALKDKNHRVVGNALVGLYKLGDESALNHMIELCANKDHLFRAAMAWAMGFVKDVRAIPALRELTTDNSLVVRKRALNSLLILEALENEHRRLEAENPEVKPEPEAAVVKEEDSPTTQPGPNMFMFK